MPYTSYELDGLFVVRWSAGKPVLADIASYSGEIAAARTRQGKPLVGMFIMPPESDAPDEEFRAAQAKRLPAIMAHLEFAVCVFEGTGFVASLKRSVLVAILLLPQRRQQVFVRPSLEDALVHDPPRPFKFDARRALAQLREQIARKAPAAGRVSV